MVNTSALAMGLALFASLAAFLYNPINTRLDISGIRRKWTGFENVPGEGLAGIPDTFGCEDLHYHEPSGIVFGVTEDTAESRERWFPPYVDPSSCPGSNSLGRTDGRSPTS